MVRYFYAWMPLLVVGTVFILSLPWLGVIALLVFVGAVLVAAVELVSAVVFVPRTLSRAISRRRLGGASPRAAVAPVVGHGSHTRGGHSRIAA